MPAERISIYFPLWLHGLLLHCLQRALRCQQILSFMSDSPGRYSTYTQTMVSQSKKSKQFFPCSGGPKFTVSSIWLKLAGWLGLLLLPGSQERNVISCDFHLQVLVPFLPFLNWLTLFLSPQSPRLLFSPCWISLCFLLYLRDVCCYI